MREKLIELLREAKAKEQYDFLFGDIDAAIDMPYGAEYYAEHLIAHGVTIQKWIPVTERLPESGKCVLVFSKDGMVAEGCYFAYDKSWTQFRWSVKDLNVTHWMPLPSAEGLE